MSSVLLYRTWNLPLQGAFQTAPLESWHIVLCFSLGIWVWWMGYTDYDLHLYAPLLRYLSPLFFAFLFLSLSLAGFLGLALPCRPLRRTVAALAAALWGFAATFYILGHQHPISFIACSVFAAQQMSVFVGLRKIIQ